jgi:hypothetical protein
MILYVTYGWSPAGGVVWFMVCRQNGPGGGGCCGCSLLVQEEKLGQSNWLTVLNETDTGIQISKVHVWDQYTFSGDAQDIRRSDVEFVLSSCPQTRLAAACGSRLHRPG